MARVRRVRINQSGMQRLVNDPTTPTHRHMARVGPAVKAAASAHAPKKSGRLASSGRWEMIRRFPKLTARIGFYERYAWWVHQGRGAVYPKRAKALRFFYRGRWVYAKRAGPAKAQPFLSKGTREVTGKSPRRIRGK